MPNSGIARSRSSGFPKQNGDPESVSKEQRSRYSQKIRLGRGLTKRSRSLSRSLYVLGTIFGRRSAKICLSFHHLTRPRVANERYCTAKISLLLIAKKPMESTRAVERETTGYNCEANGPCWPRRYNLGAQILVYFFQWIESG